MDELTVNVFNSEMNPDMASVDTVRFVILA